MTLLSTLLDEAYAYLHRALCAGALRRKLITLPFRRDVMLTPASAAAMQRALLRGMQVGSTRVGMAHAGLSLVGMLSCALPPPLAGNQAKCSPSPCSKVQMRARVPKVCCITRHCVTTMHTHLS